MSNNLNDGFSYTYSARDRDEINRIRKKYIPHKEDKLQLLRRLDASVYNKAGIIAVVIGVIGALIMGSGMSLVMTEIGEMLGMENAMIIGVIIGAVGMILVCLAYPVYYVVLKRERERIAPEILRLADELMK